MKKATQVAISEHLHGDEDVMDTVLDLPQEQQEEVLELPVLPVRNTVLMPNVMVPLLVGRDSSIKAIEEAMSGDHDLFVVTQMYEDAEDPGPNDLYTIGIEG